MILRSIDSISMGRVFGFLSMTVGGVFGILVVVGSLIGLQTWLLGMPTSMAGPVRFAAPFIALILGPLLAGATGFAFGVASALLYNATASLLGGIELDIKHLSRRSKVTESPLLERVQCVLGVDADAGLRVGANQ